LIKLGQALPQQLKCQSLAKMNRQDIIVAILHANHQIANQPFVVANRNRLIELEMGLKAIGTTPVKWTGPKKMRTAFATGVL
jgi:hypothetical protein